MASGANRLGVPPPKNTLTISRPARAGAYSRRSISRSASSAATYSRCGRPCGAVCELKSQYGHLRTHQGMCTYRASGGAVGRDMR